MSNITPFEEKLKVHYGAEFKAPTDLRLTYAVAEISELRAALADAERERDHANDTSAAYLERIAELEGQEPVAWSVTVGNEYKNCIEITHCESDASAQYEASTEGGFESLYTLHKLYAAAGAAPVPDMFWNNDDAEQQYGSIDEFLNDEICNGSLEVGDVRTVQRGVRLPNVDIRVIAIDDEECKAEWEVVPQTTAPRSAT